jgi:hypothetical protein
MMERPSTSGRTSRPLVTRLRPCDFRAARVLPADPWGIGELLSPLGFVIDALEVRGKLMAPPKDIKSTGDRQSFDGQPSPRASCEKCALRLLSRRQVLGPDPAGFETKVAADRFADRK